MQVYELFMKYLKEVASGRREGISLSSIHKKAIYDEYMCYRSAVKCVMKKCNTSLQSFV